MVSWTSDNSLDCPFRFLAFQILSVLHRQNGSEAPITVQTTILPPASEGWGKVIVSGCVSVDTMGGGRGYPICWPGEGEVPPSFLTGSTHPSQPRGYPILPNRGFRMVGTPIPGQDEGTPSWNSIACTSYTAGGMPLSFMQEDFLA